MRRSLPLALAGLLLVPLVHAEEQPPRSAAAKKIAPAKKTAKDKRETKKGPVANYPAFRVLASGASRVSVELSEKVEITEHKAEGRVVYRMKGARVPTRTNRLPLETMFFDTPVARVLLTEQDGGDVDLVIELRRPSAASHKLAETEGGVALLVDFPPAAQGAPREPSR